MGNKISMINHTDEEKEIARYCQFTVSDIKEWSAMFQALFPTRSIMTQDMELFFQNHLPDPPEKTMEYAMAQKRFCKQLFRTINIDDSGAISFNELLVSLTIVQKGSLFQKVMWLFRFYDTDNDGLISKEEFSTMINDLYFIITAKKDDDVIRKNVDDVFMKASKDQKPEKMFLDFNDFKKIYEDVNNNSKNDLDSVNDSLL